MSHKNIPVFIPHLGCPNQCVFCNQRSISGCREFDEASVERQIAGALATIPTGTETEIAFFGGSFTGIDRALMIRLLETAQKFVDAGRVQSIRLSTRPDYINAEILSVLSRFSVRTIELGLQSMDDEVLAATRRGHTSDDARRACRAIVDAGFSLVGQMMIGLPASTPEKEIATAKEIVALGASAARIYPTVVFYDTPLCEMARTKNYHALSVEEAVGRSAAALKIFAQSRVPCIRIGLCASESLTSPEEVYAGPNHPALGELVWNAYYYDLIRDAVTAAGLWGQNVTLLVPRGEESKVVGQRRCNLVRLLRETNTRVCRTLGEDARASIQAVPWTGVR